MRASKWNIDEGKRRLKSTMEWRRDFKPDLIPPDEVKIESQTGKMYAIASATFHIPVCIDLISIASSMALTMTADPFCTCVQALKIQKRATDNYVIWFGGCKSFLSFSTSC